MDKLSILSRRIPSISSCMHHAAGLNTRANTSSGIGIPTSSLASHAPSATRRTWHMTWSTMRTLCSNSSATHNAHDQTASIDPQDKDHRDRNPHIDYPSLGQPSYHTHPHNFTSIKHLTPGITKQEYAQRRDKVLDAMPDNTMMIIAGNPIRYMSCDIPYMYHANTNLVWLTGVLEPECALVLYKRTHAGVDSKNGRNKMSESSTSKHSINDSTSSASTASLPSPSPGDKDKKSYSTSTATADTLLPPKPLPPPTTFFARPNDPYKELWDGPRSGVQGVKHHFGIDNVIPYGKQLTEFMDQVIPHLDAVYYDPYVNEHVTHLISQIQSVNLLKFRNIVDISDEQVLQQRLVKSQAEIDLMRKAGWIVSEALNNTIRFTAKDKVLEEWKIAAHLEYQCKMLGAEIMSFPMVVASGNNACTLHYITNNQIANRDRNEMVMVDVGCEYHHYSSDLSRAWPLNGKFTQAQADLYSMILQVQKACIDASVADGIMNLDMLHERSVHMLVDGLRHLGVLDKNMSMDEIIARRIYTKYYPHSIGHYLGMDVHDVHRLPKSIPLRSGMVITVEPGIYIRQDDYDVPEAFRGMGIRIEDDVLVHNDSTGLKAEVLTSHAVKEIREIEDLMKDTKL